MWDLVIKPTYVVHHCKPLEVDGTVEMDDEVDFPISQPIDSISAQLDTGVCCGCCSSESPTRRSLQPRSASARSHRGCRLPPVLGYDGAEDVRAAAKLGAQVLEAEAQGAGKLLPVVAVCDAVHICQQNTKT